MVNFEQSRWCVRLFMDHLVFGWYLLLLIRLPSILATTTTTTHGKIRDSAHTSTNATNESVIELHALPYCLGQKVWYGYCSEPSRQHVHSKLAQSMIILILTMEQNVDGMVPVN